MESNGIQTLEMYHFTNFSSQLNLSKDQGNFIAEIIASMNESGKTEVVEWKKPVI